ncbi:MAG: hypothetical protein JSS07_09210 [Proteobacteria bacterium]|nr:hypothetical protein [Pseudomonadota bacterium]
MRTLLLTVLLIFMSTAFAYSGQLRETSYAPPVDSWGWKHRFDAYYGDGFGNYWDVNCRRCHKNGYYYHKHCGRYYPDYQYPRFGYYGHHYHAFFIKHARHPYPKGFYRCYNREGLSIECYKQHGKRG